MDIKDFLPKYPNIDKSEYGVLNPYEESFYEALFRKKEFYDNRLERVEEFPKERGMLTKHQKTIAYYLSSHTPYDRVLLVHQMGSGKTCSAIGAIEQIKRENSSFTGAIILAKGKPMLDNFLHELIEKCTAGEYIPDNYAKLTDLERAHRVKKMTKYYHMYTFAKFAKHIKNMVDSQIILEYSNKIIIIDEVHNLRIQEEQKKETLETYKQYHRFLHLVQNCKIILLSGTPMKDSPLEIASVANLLIPLDRQLPQGIDFLNEYMNQNGEIYTIKDERVGELKELLKGKVSFLRQATSEIPKKFIGVEHYGNLKHFIVDPQKMSKFQSKGYKRAYKKDTSGQKGVYINSREASLFVYPDGTYGREGFDKYIKREKRGGTIKKTVSIRYAMTKELREALKGDTHEETLQKIRQYSITYATVIENILKTNGNCFIYSSIVMGSGCILFSLLLELFGFSKANGKERGAGLRYGILTNKISTNTDIKRISNRFNQKDNMRGDIIKVIIGSKAVSEGFSFKNVIFESINTPHWNYSETAQALARGIRLGSHNDLLFAGDNPIIHILQPVAIPQKDKIPSIDLIMYEKSEDKDISISSILRILMECAFDCGLNYMRNHVNGVDGSRECDYATCNYKCDGIDMAMIEQGLQPDELDYSTYNLYYTNPQISEIKKRIEQLFRENIKIDLDSIIKNLIGKAETGGYSEDAIRNALLAITEESKSADLDYREFLTVYSRTPVKKIMDRIEELFREYFRLDLDSIMEQLPEYSEFEVLTALRDMINENILLTNKYGLPVYLREENNVYFLVSNLTIDADLFSEFYTKYPTISTNKTFSDILSLIYSSALPKTIKKICQVNNMDTFRQLIKTVPTQIQELFIEACLVAEEKKIKTKSNIRKFILEYFKSYIKKVDNTWVSSYGKELRCKEIDAEFKDWTDCDERFNELLIQQELEQRLEKQANNPYGIIGKYNPANNSFCIVDYQKERQSRSKSANDKRLQYSGKVCGAGGWKLPELINIAVNRLKIPPPANFRKGQTKEQMATRVKEEQKLMEIYTPDKVDELSTEDLRRALYWGTPKKDGGNRQINPLCTAIREWLERHDLLEVDAQCGVRGKKHLGTATKTTKIPYRIEIHPSNYFKDNTELATEITTLMGECYGVKKYKVRDDNTNWLIIYSRKKIVGFVQFDDTNMLSSVCIAKSYRRQGIPKDALQLAFKNIREINGREPTIVVDNRDKNSKKLLRMYKSFGFEIQRADDRNSYLIHKN